MLLAYLRNPLFVPPTYKHGIRSILRQNLILDAIEVETLAEKTATEVATLREMMVGTDHAQKRGELAHAYSQSTDMLNFLRGMDLRAARMLSPESKMGKMVQVREFLVAAKLVDNEERTFTDEEIYAIMDEMRQKEEAAAEAKS
jgi:hypothetical protein